LFDTSCKTGFLSFLSPALSWANATLVTSINAKKTLLYIKKLLFKRKLLLPVFFDYKRAAGFNGVWKLFLKVFTIAPLICPLSRGRSVSWRRRGSVLKHKMSVSCVAFHGSSRKKICSQNTFCHVRSKNLSGLNVNTPLSEAQQGWQE